MKYKYIVIINLDNEESLCIISKTNFLKKNTDFGTWRHTQSFSNCPCQTLLSDSPCFFLMTFWMKRMDFLIIPFPEFRHHFT